MFLWTLDLYYAGGFENHGRLARDVHQELVRSRLWRKKTAINVASSHKRIPKEDTPLAWVITQVRKTSA